MQLKTVPSLDAKLSDICLGTSAAPSQLPPYEFWNGGHHFNLVDGALTANSPVNSKTLSLIFVKLMFLGSC